MYLPAHFAEQRIELLHKFIRAYPLSTLITQAEGAPEANHVPLHLVAEVDSAWCLRGHLARANPAWQQHPPASEVLAIFHGPQAYVTPSWYPSKRENGKAVPTWNYLAVHVRGRLRVIDDPRWLLEQLTILVAEHEAGFDLPWTLEEAPADYIDKMLAAIVGIEITILEIQGKWKISQNQPVSNRAGVVSGLRQRDSASASAMATLVAATLPAKPHV